MPDSNYNSFLSLAGAAYGTDARLLAAIHNRENSGRTTFDVNNWDSNAAAGTPSGGPFQFIKPTFDAFARQAKAANPAAWRGVPVDWKDPRAQALAASWAMANGKGSHWSTYAKAKADVPGMKPLVGGRVAPQGAMEASGGASVDSGSRASALSLIFGGDPLFAAAAARASATPAAPVARAVRGGQRGAEGAGFFKRLAGETGQQYLDRLLQKKFGLKHDPGNSQTTGGRHSTNSRHYAGLATDYGNARNDPSTLQAAEDWVDQNRDKFVGGISELLYGPDVPGHADHLHVATVRALRGPKQKGRFA